MEKDLIDGLDPVEKEEEEVEVVREEDLGALKILLETVEKNRKITSSIIKTLEKNKQQKKDYYSKLYELNKTLLRTTRRAKRYRKRSEDGMNYGSGSLVNSYTVDGPMDGYTFPPLGDDVELHGLEQVNVFDNGFSVRPIETPTYSMSENPGRTIQRHRDLDNELSFESGGNWWDSITNNQITRTVLRAVQQPLQSISNSLRPQGLARGTSGVRAGFTGMNAEGFDAMMRGDAYRQSSKPQILGHGAYSAPTRKGAERYAGATGSLGGRQRPGGVINSIVPGNAPRINILEPQAKVSPKMFDKGRDLATRLMNDPTYRANSPLAQRLRQQMAEGVSRGAARGGGTKLALRAGTRSLAGLGARAVPFAGIPLALADAGERFSKRDFSGGMLGLLSGVPGPIGWLGLGTQLAHDAMGLQNLPDVNPNYKEDLKALPGGGIPVIPIIQGGGSSGPAALPPTYTGGEGLTPSVAAEVYSTQAMFEAQRRLNSYTRY